MENRQKRKFHFTDCGPYSTRHLKILCSITKRIYTLIDNFKYAKMENITHQLETIIFKILLFSLYIYYIYIYTHIYIYIKNHLFQWLNNSPCDLFQYSLTSFWHFSFATINNTAILFGHIVFFYI